jgi:hypothetical protein
VVVLVKHLKSYVANWLIELYQKIEAMCGFEGMVATVG